MDKNAPLLRASKIARLNDLFRAMGEDVIITQGIANGVYDIVGLLRAVATFSDFNADNDPHGEHDFGVIHWHRDTIFWKIDYYEGEYQFWCDPLDPACSRVLTVMLAEEY